MSTAIVTKDQLRPYLVGSGAPLEYDKPDGTHYHFVERYTPSGRGNGWDVYRNDTLIGHAKTISDAAWLVTTSR
jgi:hypothetical protein